MRLPAELGAALERLQHSLARELAGWRWVAAHDIHLTLRFLGEVGPALDLAAREVWRRAIGPVPPFAFQVRGVGQFPLRGRPRVLWAGVSLTTAAADGLDELAARVESAARELGFAADARPFRAHLTLARARREGRADHAPAIDFAPAIDIRVERVVLFRSELGSGGPRYTALEEFPLEGLLGS